MHPLVRKDDNEQQAAVDRINSLLNQSGYELATQETVPPRIFRVQPVGSSSLSTPAYEVVLSFAGEQRGYVEEVAHVLTSVGVRIFYDSYEVADMWGKDLVEHLANVYGGTARYCVMFISADYVAKIWPSHERRSAFAAALARRTEYILPVRFDDSEVPGLLRTVHYLEASKYIPNHLARLILHKLGRI